MNFKQVITIAITVFYNTLYGQKVTVLTEDHQLNSDRPEMVHVEPHLAINPSNPNHLVVASIVLSNDFSDWSSAVFASFDGGTSWARYDFEMERCIDPWVSINEDGSVFITAIEILRNVKNDLRFNMLLFNSSDGGITWNKDKNSLGRGFDHEMIIPSNTNEPSHYLMARKARDLNADSTLYDFYLGSSNDYGQTFEMINQFKPEETPKDINPTGIEILNENLSIVSFIEFPTFLTKSIQLTNGGTNISTAVVISNKCGECSNFPGYPSLAMGSSSEQPLLHHVCIGKEFDGVWYSRSTDVATTWEDAIRVDTAPDQGSPHVRTPMLAVNNQGVIGVAWYDRRNDPENNCQDIYFIASIDNGATFSEPSRISTETSCPNSSGNGDTYNSWPGGGDYNSMEVDADGLFHIIWSDSRTGTAQLRHISLKVE